MTSPKYDSWADFEDDLTMEEVQSQIDEQDVGITDMQEIELPKQ